MKIVKNTEWGRLAKKAGITRISSFCYDELDMISEQFLKIILSKSVIYAQDAGRKTLFPEDVVEGVIVSGYSKIIMDWNHNVPRCKISEGKKIITRIRHYQKQYDCFIVAKAPFKDYVKKEIQVLKSEWDGHTRLDGWVKTTRISEEALTVLQFAFESFIVSLLIASVKAMVHAHRITLFPIDIRFIKQTLTRNCLKIAI